MGEPAPTAQPLPASVVEGFGRGALGDLRAAVRRLEARGLPAPPSGPLKGAAAGPWEDEWCLAQVFADLLSPEVRSHPQTMYKNQQT